MNLFFKALCVQAMIVCFPGFSQTSSSLCNEIDKVLLAMQEHHFQPVELNGEVKKEMIHLYVDKIDTRNRFIDKGQLEELSTIAVTDGLCAAYLASENMFLEGLKYYDSLLHEFTGSPVKFYKENAIADNKISKKHLRYTQAEFTVNLKRMMTLDYLNLAYEHAVNDSIAFTSDEQLTPELDSGWRSELLEFEEIYLKRMLENESGTEKILFEQFLNALVMRFDPHSNYFSPVKMEEFIEDLSGETTSFGIQLQENNDFEMEVIQVMPGSSAWFSGEITKGDVIEGVVVSKKKSFDFRLKGISFVTEVLKDPANDELVFIVRKQSGEIIEVELTRTEIENVDNAFRGYLMEKDEVKLGYISLPSFYTDFESDAHLGCANDVAKEIIFLKKEGIDGLVLDLRYNGGGSVKEAVELCGIFIQEGPMSVLERRDEKPVLLKDMNRGTVYDGPLIVLINGYSASASEMVAGCLQDYNRALIVGDVSYGKGTAQSIYTLDVASGGQVKITDGKFYTVSRRSNQSKGIVPDILVKDIFSSVDFFKEKHKPFRLANDSTSKKVIFKPFPQTISKESILKSQERINQSAYFNLIKDYSDSLKRLMDEDQLIPLEFVPYMNYRTQRTAFIDRLYAAGENENVDITIKNHEFVERMLALDPQEKKMNDETIEDIKTDAILQETLDIFREIYTFNTN